jgi:hypothetical protein
MKRVRRAAALGAVFGVGASLALVGPLLAQTLPNPDPDPHVQPDPVPAHVTPTASAPPPRVPASHRTRSAGSAVVPAQSAPSTSHPAAPRPSRSATDARSSHRSRSAGHPPHRARVREPHPAAAPKAWQRLASLASARALFATPGDERSDDRSRARALSLAAIALLLVVVAGGSLLRLSAHTPRRRGWA